MRCAWPKPVRTCRFPTLHAEPAEVFSLRRCALGSAILVLIAALRIVATYTVLSHTIDEPIHLGAGTTARSRAKRPPRLWRARFRQSVRTWRANAGFRPGIPCWTAWQYWGA